MKMMYSLQINIIVECGATGIGLLDGGRIEGESVVVNGPTSLNFGDGDCFFVIRRSFGDFRSLILVENVGKNGAESTKYWSNSSKCLYSLTEKYQNIMMKYALEEKTGILQDKLSLHMKKHCSSV